MQLSTKLLAQLEQIKEAQDTTIVSSSKEATPLWVFLKLLTVREKSNLDCNIDFRFAQVLYEYLAPIELPILSEEQQAIKFPIFMGWGQIHGIAVMIANCPRINMDRIEYTKKAILHTMYTRILPELYL